jgi:hypothetical protein
MSSKLETPVEPIASEDLQQLVELSHFLASARDALSDNMVSRIARATSEGLNQLDRLTRNEGLMYLLQILNYEDSQRLLFTLADVLRALSHEISETTPASGGFAGAFGIVREPGTQEGLRLLALIGTHLSSGLREGRRSKT